VLTVASSEEASGPGLALRRASLRRFPALASGLLEETGIDVELDACGVLGLWLDAEDERAGAERLRARRADGDRVETLDIRRVHEEEPAVNPACRGALLFPDDSRVRPDLLVAALVAAARARGAEIVPGVEARDVERSGERIVRVRVGADWVTPGAVVLAAGAWSASIPALGGGLGVQPARGQMLALRPARPLCRHVLAHGDAYLVPRRDGEVLVGATVEHVGFTKGVTAAGLAALVERVARLAPAGLEAPVVRTWSGLRPFAPSGPIVGRSPETSNLLVATGHHRSGVLLAPVTAVTITALLDGASPPPEASAFLPAAAGRA
jgi:glycine oxidase